MISIVIPCYNSEESINEVITAIKIEMIKLKQSYEIILVNDNSNDHTYSEIKKMCQQNNNIIGINLSKNFGQHNAIMAGLHNISKKSEYVLFLDDDLQTHPSQISKLIDKINDGYDVVYGTYAEKQHSFFRNLGSKFNAWTIRLLTDRPKHIQTSSFWIAKRYICDEILKYKSSYPFLSGLVFRITHNVGNITIEHFQRKYGKSNYNLKKLIKLWSTLINFSVIPLRVSIIFGIILGVLGIISTIVIIIKKMVNPNVPVGWTSIMATMFILSGINLIFMGIIGEYIGRIFMASNDKPQFIVKEIIGKKYNE